MEIVALGSKIAFLSLFTACLLLPSIQCREIKYCNKKADYVVKVHDVVISPDPVKTGEATTFTIKASTNQALTGGKLALDVSYFGIKVHSETHNICEKTSCPISVGKFVLSHTQTLPGITPPELYQHSLAYHTFSGSEFVCTSRTYRATFRMIGSYTLKLRIEDEKKHQLTCASFSFDIGFGSSAFAIAYTFLR